MEGQESLLDTLFDEENFEDGQDIEMLDVEEGELVEHISKTRVGESSNVDDIREIQESNKQNSRQKKRKKKNKNKRGGSSGPNVNNINRFVLDACKRLREKKTYLMYNAVGCLGAAALSDLIKEVDAIQACGGQKTADGSRSRNGGGILWNIIKVRDPNAYKEIMKKGKDFEKQLFKQQKPEPLQHTETSSKIAPLDISQVDGNPTDNLELPPRDASQHDISTAPCDESHHDISTAGQKRAPVHDRIRMPVVYDDDLLGQSSKDTLA